MKKLLFTLALITLIATTASFAFAADSEKIWGELLKITEKSASEVSYAMDTKTKSNGQEYNTKMNFFFKDLKTFRVDSEVSGQKTRMVVTPTDAWVYLEAQKIITPMDRSSIDSINVKESLEKQKGTSDVSEGKDGENITYTIIDKTTKYKTVFTVDSKLGVYNKMAVYNEKGELNTEAVYKDWKFGKQDDSVFKKPEGAQEMKPPAPGAQPEAPKPAGK